MQNLPQALNLSNMTVPLMDCPYLRVWLPILWLTMNNPSARRRLKIAYELKYLRVEDEDWGNPQIIVDPE